MGDSPTEDDQVGSPSVPGPVASYTITPEEANDVISQRTRYLNTLDADNEEVRIIFIGTYESSEADVRASMLYTIATFVSTCRACSSQHVYLCFEMS
jgi:hypothetical protein